MSVFEAGRTGVLVELAEDGPVDANKLKEKLPAGRVVYLHCAAGGRCRIAADHLRKLGYDVRPLKDGYDSVLDAGFEKAK